MPETITATREIDDSEQNWDAIFERIRIIGFPEDTHARADDIAKNMSNGKDIEMFGKALHDVLVPDTESNPVDYAMKMIGRDGTINHVLMAPEEREGLFREAAEYVTELTKMREASGDDEEFLRRAGNVVALTIVGAHSYANGNGRTARVTAELIRFGTENPEDLVVLGTERDVSEKQQGGFRVFSYQPTWQSIDRGESIHDTLKAAAALDIPFDQKQTYAENAQRMFISSHGD